MTWIVRDFDVCRCGDYRHQHVEGKGRCKMPNDLTHGFEPCIQFRLFDKATEIPKSYAAPSAREEEA